jgi:uncharacterized protein (UPF0332 family)
MDPRENIGLARHLLTAPKGPLPEASYRAACGRAYYCAFVVARDLLLASKFSVPRSGGAHKVVVDHLKSSSTNSVKVLGGLLDDLRLTRNSADYEVGKLARSTADFVPPKVQLKVLLADQLVADLQAEAGKDPRLGIS